MPSPSRRASRELRRPLHKVTSRSPVFDVKLFLDSAGLRRKIRTFREEETIFTQGDPANRVLHIQEGSVKLTVVNEAGKEAVVA